MRLFRRKNETDSDKDAEGISRNFKDIEENIKKLSKISESDKWGFTIAFDYPNVQCDYCSKRALMTLEYENDKFVCCKDHTGNAVTSIDFAYKQKKASEKRNE